MLFECMGICVFSPAQACEMRASLVYLLIVKYLSILFKFTHGILQWTALSPILGEGSFFDPFLEGSVDHVIYRDYIENRSSFISSNLACVSLRDVFLHELSPLTCLSPQERAARTCCVIFPACTETSCA